MKGLTAVNAASAASHPALPRLLLLPLLILSPSPLLNPIRFAALRDANEDDEDDDEDEDDEEEEEVGKEEQRIWSLLVPTFVKSFPLAGGARKALPMRGRRKLTGAELPSNLVC